MYKLVPTYTRIQLHLAYSGDSVRQYLNDTDLFEEGNIVTFDASFRSVAVVSSIHFIYLLRHAIF